MHKFIHTGDDKSEWARKWERESEPNIQTWLYNI